MEEEGIRETQGAFHRFDFNIMLTHIQKFVQKLAKEHLDPSKSFTSQSLRSLNIVREEVKFLNMSVHRIRLMIYTGNPQVFQPARLRWLLARNGSDPPAPEVQLWTSTSTGSPSRCCCWEEAAVPVVNVPSVSIYLLPIHASHRLLSFFGLVLCLPSNLSFLLATTTILYRVI